MKRPGVATFMMVLCAANVCADDFVLPPRKLPPITGHEVIARVPRTDMNSEELREIERDVESKLSKSKKDLPDCNYDKQFSANATDEEKAKALARIARPKCFSKLAEAAEVEAHVAAATTTDIPSTGTAASVPASLETRLINGFADFVTARAEAELVSYVLNEMYDKICLTQQAAVFPNTCRYFRTVQDPQKDGIDASQLGAAFQVAVGEDVETFLNPNTGHVPPELRDVMKTLENALKGDPPTWDSMNAALNPDPCKKNVPCGDLRLIALAGARFSTCDADHHHAGGEWANCANDLKSVEPDVDFAPVVADLEKVNRPQQITFARAMRMTARDLLREPDPTMALIDYVNPRIEPVAKIGEGVLVVVEGMRRHGNPVALATETMMKFDCHSAEANDVGCELQAAGVALTAITTAKSAGIDWTTDWTKADATQIEAFKAAVKKRICEMLERATQRDASLDDLNDWFRNYPDAKKAFDDASADLIPHLISLHTDIDTVRKDAGKESTPDHRAALKRDSQAVVTDTFGVWRAALQLNLPEQPESQVLTLIDDLEAGCDAVVNGEYGIVVASAITVAGRVGLQPSSGGPYLPLVTALATAQNEQQVTAALEKYAAPAGSWRSKHGRRSYWLNAWVGGTVGYVNDGHEEAALYAPVGFEFAHGGWGFLLSPIDIGNVVAVRYKAKSSSSPSGTTVGNVKFSDVVAPGAMLYWRISESPVGFGFSATAVPKTDDPHARTLRAGFFFAVDVPLFALR